MIKRFNGFNVAVKKENLPEIVTRWAKIFGVEAKYYSAGDFAVPGVMGAKLEIGGIDINILAGEDESVAIDRFVKRKGEGVFLVSFEVDSVEEAMQATSEKGAKFVADKPMPFSGGNFAAGKANFMHPKTLNGVQVELVQYDK
jgi:methylmalonyl-CoA/ethylmalonyl-CoA epimerase